MSQVLRALRRIIRPWSAEQSNESLRVSEALTIEKRRMARFTREVVEGRAPQQVFVVSGDFLDDELFGPRGRTPRHEP
jgi:hypothetical protein